MRLHPWHDNWLLVLVKRPDCKNLDHALTQCPNDLFMTQVGVVVESVCDFFSSLLY